MSDLPRSMMSRLTVVQLSAFAAPSALLFLFRAASYVIPALYAARFGFALADIAAILFAMRTAEALVQIPAGYLSDATRHTRWGRKPMIFGCIVVAAAATFQLYVPPPDAGKVYFSVWLSLATLAGSVAEVAYGAWSTEITSDYHERGRAASYQSWASIAGKELFSVVPLLWFLSSNRITFESLHVLAWTLVALVPLIVVASWALTPAGAAPAATEPLRLRQMWSIVVGNRPLQIVLAASLSWEVAIGFAFSLDFMRIDSYLKAGEAVPYQGLFGVWAGMAGLAMLSLLLKRYEKHHLWTFAMLSLGVILAAQVALYPGMPGMLVVLVGVSLLIYGLVAGAVVVPLALMGDLADYEAWRSGNRAAGPLVAIMQLGYKLAGGAASASALYAVSLFGFQPGQPSYDSTASFGIEAINLALPAALVFMAAAIAWRYPITQRRHKAILRALERRSGRQARLP